MKLDLSQSAPLKPEHRDELGAIALDTRQAFNDLVHRLSVPHGDDIDWWVTPVGSRNTFSCALFLRCCQLRLALRIAGAGGISEILVESPALATVLRAALAARGIAVPVRARRGAIGWRVYLLAGMGYRLAAALYHALGQYLFSRLFPPRSRPAPAEPIVLVDTFVYRDSFKEGFRDRHYPGLLDCLSEEQKQRVYLLPTYYKVRNYAWLFRTLRSSSVRFLPKEDLLGISDYAFALTHPFRLLAYTVDRCELESIDVAPLVNEALHESFAASSSFEGLLRYRLAQRMQQAGIRVSAVLDWFENQEMDHGSNAGLRRFLPETRIVGYQGFVVSRHYLCMFPTRDEMRFGLIPHRIAVTGQALVEPVREFCPELDVCVAPALRFSGLWRERKVRSDAGWFTILVALPLMRSESDEIMETVAASAADLPRAANGARWRVRVKSHPAAVARTLRDTGARAAATGFEVVDGDFDDLLGDCDVLVSSASTVCVEALACGVPVIVLGNSRGITLNPIPDEVDRELWKLCHTPAQLSAALHDYARRDRATIARHRELGMAIRERYFAPFDREAVISLLLSGCTPPAAGAARSAADHPLKT